jgi:serine/threonine protein kinase
MSNSDKMAAWPGWETVRVIGRGSVGTVYEIRRSMFGETERCALKHISIPHLDGELFEMRSCGMNDREIAQRLEEQAKSVMTEYQMMKRLNDCPHVVTCHDVNCSRKEDGVGWDIYIRMELLTPLVERLTRQMDWPEEETIRMGRDLCKALCACQKLKIVHRDVKPQNLFLASDGSYKLGDFGIARIASITGSATGRKGTFSFMAPEVYNCEHYGPLADQYSLGMVLYWLLNNRRVPFVAANTPREKELALRRRMRGEPIPPPINGRPALHRIILKAIAFDPACRYPDAEEMLLDLEKLDADPGAAGSRGAGASGEDITYGGFRRETGAGESAARPSAETAPKRADMSRPAEFPRREKTEIANEGPGPERFYRERPERPASGSGEAGKAAYERRPKPLPPETPRKPAPARQPAAGGAPEVKLHYSRVEDDMRRAREQKQAQTEQARQKKKRKGLWIWSVLAVLLIVAALLVFLKMETDRRQAAAAAEESAETVRETGYREEAAAVREALEARPDGGEQITEA